MTGSGSQISAYAPLSYLFLVRLNGIGKKYKYAAFNLGVSFLGLWKVHPGITDTKESLLFLLCWISFLCVYETGYFANDRVAAPRERRSAPPGHRIFANIGRTPFLTSRYLAFLGLSLPLCAFAAPYPFYAPLILPIATALLFHIHNSIQSEWRILPLTALYFVKYNIPFFLLPDAEALWAYVWAYNLEILPAVLFLAWYYFGLKHYTRQYHKSLGPIATGSVSFLFLAGIAWVLYIHSGSAWSLGFVALVHLTGGILNATLSVWRALFDRETAVHFHTKYSFDSKFDPDEIKSILSGSSIRTCYVTDHDKNLDPDKYLKNRTAFAASMAARDTEKTGTPIDFKYGVECDINRGNHFLLCNLERFEEAKDFSDLAKYRNAVDTIIWAHPSTAYLFNLKSLANTLRIAENIDGIEVINLRPRRKYYSHILTFGLAFLFAMVFNKKLYVGFDSHSKRDLLKTRNTIFQRWKWVSQGESRDGKRFILDPSKV